MIIAVLYWFFGTELGCSLRATGANANMARAQGINTNLNKVLGLMISNGLVALSGALLSQYQSFADINMGRGAIVIGLAAVIIGEVIFGKIFRNFALKLLAVAIGSIIYYVVIQAVVSLSGINSNYLKLLSAMIVALFLAVPYWKARYLDRPAAREARTMLEIINLRKTFNPGTVNEKTALDGVSLTLRDGDFVSVIGGNGAGKSTLLNAVAGTWLVDSGTISIDGVNVTRLPEHKRAQFIGRVFQDPMMGTAATMQIEENLALALRRGKRRTLRAGITAAERDRYRELLKILGLGLEDRLTTKVGSAFRRSATGVDAAHGHAAKAKAPASGRTHRGLDPKTAAKVLETTERIIQRDHLTTLMITHNMRDAIAHGNRLIMMYDGRIVVDVSGEEKQRLTVEDLLALFEKASGQALASDRMLLG